MWFKNSAKKMKEVSSVQVTE